MARRRSKKGWTGPVLVGLNVAVVVGIGALLWERAQTPVDVLRASTVVDEGPAPVDWDGRFAEGADADPTCAGCNVVMVSLDIFRPDHMPCFGYPKNTAPNICAMVDHGVVFDNFIVHAYQTPVSQMTLFTGRYASSSGFVSFASLLSEDVPYLPEQLHNAGYQTIAMGSSFEVMTDMSASESARRRFSKKGLNPGLSFGRGFDRFVFTGNRNLPTDSIGWLQSPANTQRPFFLWMILGTLHWPYGSHSDPAVREMFDEPGYDGVLARERSLNFDVVSRIYGDRLYDKKGGRSVPFGPEDGAHINARYDVGLWTVDQFVGELLASVPPDVMKNTVFILHGVHGEDLGEHGYFGHYDVFDTEVRSTLIVLNPRHAAKGVRIAEQMEGVDLAPTLLDVLDLSPMPNTDGQSLKSVLQAGKGDPHRVAFFERIPLWEDIFRHKGGMPKAFVDTVTALLDAEVVGDTGLRTSRWKLLHRKARAIEEQVSWYGWLSGTPVRRAEWELYDLSKDPTEQHNVAAAHPEVLQGLQATLLQWEDSLPETKREWAPIDSSGG